MILDVNIETLRPIIVVFLNTCRKTLGGVSYLRGLTMAGGAVGNQVSTRRTTSTVL